MRRVDAHAHWAPPSFVAALSARGDPPCLVSGDGGMRMVDCGDGLAYPLFDGMVDLAEQERAMDAVGIALAVVALPPPGVGDAAVSRACNDELAALDGRRFAGLATLPLGDPDAAAAEVARAAALGLAGAQLWSNAGGEALDGERYRVVFEAAEAADVPLVMHPTLPVSRAGLDAYGLVTTLGFVYETTTAALRLIMSGLFDRHPGLRLLVPHVGSLLPYLAGRIDYESRLFGFGAQLERAPSEYIGLLYTDSVCLWPPALRLALDVLGPDRVLFGTDYPFWEPAAGVETVEHAGVASDALWSGNAERLFGLAGG